MAEAKTPSDRGRIDNLQILRAVAALAVVVSHSCGDVIDIFGAGSAIPPLPGQFGVEIFFVISGFIIWHIASRDFSKPGAWKHFAWNRAWRVIPLYWLTTLAYIAIGRLVPGAINRDGFEWTHVLASFVFIPVQGPSGSMSPIYSLGWSLNYEMFFYAIMACLLGLRARTALIVLSVVMVVLASLHPFTPVNTAPWVWTRAFVIEFLAGVLLSALWARYARRLPAGLFLPGLAVALTAIIAYFQASFGPAQVAAWADGAAYPLRPETMVMAVGLVAFGLFCAQPNKEIWIRKPLKLIGDASFSLYLTHMFVVRIAAKVAEKAHVERFLSPPIFWAMLVLLCCVAAYFSYMLIEKPGADLAKTLWRKFNRPAAAEKAA
ncbi:acyltransferase family protein [Caulobacter sp.]|uniref:acyltransferase family protein n=1 Tax=Caulobacter sp. TaxID=78 RepID=UPI003BA96993